MLEILGERIDYDQTMDEQITFSRACCLYCATDFFPFRKQRSASTGQVIQFLIKVSAGNLNNIDHVQMGVEQLTKKKKLHLLFGMCH